MDPIDNLSRISQLFRKKLSERRIAGDKKTSAKQSTDRATVESKPKLTSAEIKSLIKARIHKLGPAQRDSQKAALIFVESILAWEFGDEVLNDPKFSEISKEVQLTITESSEHWGQFQEMLRSL